MLHAPKDPLHVPLVELSGGNVLLLGPRDGRGGVQKPLRVLVEPGFVPPVDPIQLPLFEGVRVLPAHDHASIQ